MELKTWEELVIEKKHVAAVALGGLLLAGAVIFFANDAVNAPTPAAQNQAVVTVDAPVARPAPKKSAGGVMRDPFAAPAEFRQAVSADGRQDTGTAVPSSYSGGAGFKDSGKFQPSKPLALPVFQGAAISGDQRMAVLQMGEQSRSYRLGEKAGAFEVIGIEKDSITLSGPDGKVVLAMER